MIAEINNALALLAETPHRLTLMTDSYDGEQLQAKPAPDAWSANDILAHLRACADVWGKSMVAMMVQDHPTLRYVSPRTWMKKTPYAAQAFQPSLDAFLQQRAELLQLLSELKQEEWTRGATFTGTVRGKEATILSYAQRMVDHEQQHLAQLATLLTALEP